MKSKNFAECVGLIENFAKMAKEALQSIELIEDECNCFSYDLNEEIDIFKWINEDAVIDYFED